MINVQTLGMLLRTLQSGEAPGRGAVPLQPLAPTQSVKPIAPEGAQTPRSGAFDSARSEPGKSDPRTPGTPAAPRSSSGPPPRGAIVEPAGAGAQPQRAPEVSAVVTLGLAAAAEPAAQVSTGSPAPAAANAASTPTPAVPAAEANRAAIAVAAPGPPAAAALSLSPTAQLVDTLLRLPGGRPIVPASPLVPAPDVPPEVLAGALQRSIADSGLFYESHLARWVVNRHPAAALRQEPQATWPAPPAPATVGAAPDTIQPPLPAVATLPLADTEPAAASPATAAPAASAGASVPDAAPALVRAQLDVLETGQILWRGDLWQGQPATLEIHEEDAGRDPGAPPAWNTRLALTLPGLGPVEARLSLAGTRIQLRLVAADEARAAPLTAALPELAAALSARGLEVAPIRVDHERPR